MNARKRICGALLLTSLALTPAAAVSNNPWYDAFVTYDNASGTAYTASTDAAFLAWQESFIQRSYLNLYETTGDTAWLAKFVTHADTVTGPLAFKLSDTDSYPDWTTSRYSPDLTVNGTFDTADGTDATLPAGWIRNGSTSATAARTNAPGEFITTTVACVPGGYGLKLTTAGGTAQRLYRVLTGYKPGHKYQLTFSGKNGGSVHGRVFVYDRTANLNLASIEVTSGAWTSYAADFTMPAAGHTVEVWIAHMVTTPAAQSAFFENVRVAPYFSYHVLDGMIGIPLANFVRLVHRNPVTLAAFQTAATAYRQLLENQVIAKWQDAAAYYGNTWVGVSATEGYYREPTNHDTFSSSTVLDPLPYNQYFALLELQNILYDVNASSAYLAKAEQGATYFANRLTLPAGTAAYTWYYAAFAGSKIEDASHVNVDMEFITELHRSGSVFLDVDMLRFTGTLTDNLWNGSATAPQLNNMVTGVQGSYCTNYGFSRTMYGWVPLAQFDSRAWQIAATQYAAQTPSGHDEAVTLSQIIRWDPVKLVNQGFELPAPSDATLPARWTRSLSTAATAYRDSVNKKSGDYGLSVKSNGTSYQRLVQAWTGFVPGASYTVTFDAKADTSGAEGRVWVQNTTTATTVAAYNFSNTAWQTHTFTFTAPATATDAVNVQVGHRYYTVNNGLTHYDNVVVKRTGDAW
ncbi:MAG: carbohydrate binding domain-containing protein [Undibacterium sp.]|nr:carbohydrate binding domain-containing protein [Opitutaceae bacterium]